MAQFSAGILLYRFVSGVLEVLLIHPGGPFWRNRDAGAWMIPKGGLEEGEEPLACALREFEEEVGTRLSGALRPLCRIRQKGGKWVEAFALEGDLDAAAIVSNLFEIESPRGSGRMRSYPEVDRAAWFSMEAARAMILPSQMPILDALEASL
jgi:predicted NUDIX family NTP pyrophosphohydrolase